MTYQFSSYGDHVGLRVFKLLLGHAHILDETIIVENMGWAFKSSLYLEQLKSYGEFVIYLIIHMSAMWVFDFR